MHKADVLNNLAKLFYYILYKICGVVKKNAYMTQAWNTLMCLRQ